MYNTAPVELQSPESIRLSFEKKGILNINSGIIPSRKFQNIEGDSKLEVQTLRRDRVHHKDSELRRNPCPQTSSQL